jgi:hypothetical protein
LHLRVDLPDGRYTLVPEGGDEGADEELQYEDIAQGLDKSPEGPKANLASEGKPQIINPYFKIMQICLLLKDRLGDQRGGSEWEPIKILLEGD